MKTQLKINTNFAKRQMHEPTTTTIWSTTLQYIRKPAQLLPKGRRIGRFIDFIRNVLILTFQATYLLLWANFLLKM